MLTMSGYFEELRKAVEPDPQRKKEAQRADDPVREHLSTHWSFADRHVATFLYGSYARQTAEGDIKDVDLVVVTNYTTRHHPLAVLNALKDSLAYLFDAIDLADQRRSIRVDRPLPNVPSSHLTLDVIPAIYQGGPDGPLWVPDREKKLWVPSHPKGHMQYTSALNARSAQGVAFVRLTKMMKWWWRYQFDLRQGGTTAHKRKPKGFWIEVMTGQYTNVSYESYPELIMSLLENAFRAFASFRTHGRISSLPDPSLPGQSLATSMTTQEFSFFLDTLEHSLHWARLALQATSEDTTATYWQQLFGEKFPSTQRMSQTTNLLSPAASVGGLSFPPRPLQPRKPGGFA